MTLLLQERMIPFLWDLDRGYVEYKLGEKDFRGDIEWDFELLIRRLCHFDCREDVDALAGIPNGLRNRQRIWTLVTGMYVGDGYHGRKDGLSGNHQRASVPRYWDELGEPQHPLVWM